MKEVYEMMAVVKPLLVEDIKEKIIPRLEKEVKKLKGNLTIKDNIGKRLLAYPIEGYKEGYYLVYSLEIETNQLEEFKRFLSLSEDVLRFLIIREDQL